MQQVCICELASPPCSLLWLSLSLPGTLRGLLRYLRMEDMAFHRWEGSCHGTGQITLPVLQSSPATGQNGLCNVSTGHDVAACLTQSGAVELEVAGLNWISFLDQSRVLWYSPNQIGHLVWVLPGHPTSIEWGILKPVSCVVKVTISSPSQWVDLSPSPKSLFYDHALN
ncbi:hypothetical protein ZIOFF_019246 [Zingiber officinale]|uniref:Uncharacterized protein n=1 Tax=Zingiber officinale TaxID=94328 RepID=A0A8J5H995_ZINOF|nr:hypothetical protein ZIOFF_019246 [Zingiber officinale]